MLNLVLNYDRLKGWMFFSMTPVKSIMFLGCSFNRSKSMVRTATYAPRC